MFNILLDTEVFRHENLHFQSRRFLRLIDLVRTEAVSVYVTDFTADEVRAAISSAVHKAIQYLRTKKIRRILGVLAQSVNARLEGAVSKLDEQALVDELVAKFDGLLADLDSEVIATDDVPIATVRGRYFDCAAPFGPSKPKKHEFPDAISILAAEALAKERGIVLHVVSGDPDLAAAAELTSVLKHADSLQTMTDRILSALNATAARAEAAHLAVEALAEGISKGIGKAFLEESFYVEDDYGEVEEVTVENVDVGELTVAKIEDAVATLSFGAEIDYSAELEVADPDQTAYDSETKEVIIFGYLRRTVSASEYVEGEVEVEIDLSEPSTSSLLGIALFTTSVGVSLDDQRYCS